MRKNSKNEKVIRAMAIGISAMLMASSPLTALAAEGEGCEFPYKSRVMPTSEPLKSLKAPYMARNPMKWGFFRLKSKEMPL